MKGGCEMDRMEEFLQSVPPEMREIAKQQAEKAIAFRDLLNKVKASAAAGIDIAHPENVLYMVTSSRELPEETQKELQGNCPFPLKFLVGLKPETLELFNEIGKRMPLRILKHNEVPTKFMVEMDLPEEVPEEVRDELLSKVIPVVNSLLEGDGYPKQWGITLNGNTVFETKAAVSEDDVEDLKARLDKAQTIDDILNSI